MTEKFTEEEYQKIVEIADKTIKGIYFGSIPVRNFWNELSDSLVGKKYYLSNYWKEIIAIANQATRDEAHEKFVEKGKEYYWRYKKTDEDGGYWFLVRYKGLIIAKSSTPTHSFTEKEIIESGYNPDMYEKKEVKS